MLRQVLRAAVAAAAFGGSAIVATGAAACPDFNYAPHFGDITLVAGFQPDPYVMNVTAGGTQALQNCGFNATGFVTTRPDFRLYWNGSSSQLTICPSGQCTRRVVVLQRRLSRNQSGHYLRQSARRALRHLDRHL